MFDMSNTSPSLLFFTSADAINNAAGFGFNGYNEDGSPRWDLISNLRILNIEVRTVRVLDFTHIDCSGISSSPLNDC